MSEFRKKVDEKYKDLFKGFSFNFEGLKERTKEGFVELVKKLGAEVSDDARFTFVEQSYFQKKNNNTKDNYYDINYIIEAVESIDSSNLLNYRFVNKHNYQVPNDEPMCYGARYFFKTDSCHTCYYKKIFCKECAKSSNELQEDTNHCIKAIAMHSIVINLSSEYENEIPKASKTKDEKNQGKSSKRLFSLESEDHYNDEEQSQFVDGRTKIHTEKKLKNSCDIDKTLHKCMFLESVVENNDNRGNTDTLKNSGEISNRESTNKKSKRINSPRKQRAVTRNSNASSIEEDDYSDDSSVNENKKQPQKLDKKRSGWVLSSKTKAPLSQNEQPEELSDEEFSGKIIVNHEAQAYFKRELWWLPHNILERERCIFPKCTYEPESHPTHYQPRKFLSLIEKKIIVKYLINNNGIPSAKGKKIYVNMINDGYLSHRSWETLRNCFRRTILKEIKSYGLVKNYLNQFLTLENKNLNIIMI